MTTIKQPILITAGGTGGHVYPGLAVARALQAKDIPIVWMGTRNGLEARVIPEAGIPMAWLTVNGLRGKGWQAWLAAPWRLLVALGQSVKIMREHKPAAVLGMGGFVAGPGGLVASLMGIPLVIHEQNAVAGLTNRLLASFSKRVLEGFPKTFPASKKLLATGNPVRNDIAALPAPELRHAAREGQKVHLLIIGGSLGAAALNEVVPQALALIPEWMRPEVRHQAGTRNLETAQANYQSAQVAGTVTAYIEDMAEAYSWADLIICRAGALTIAEVAAAGLASILVPYPHAVDDHQTANAAYLADHGAALLMPQSHLTAQTLSVALQELCTDRPRLLHMAQAARQLAKPQATEEVAAICAEYAGYHFNEQGQVA
ncbi:undecaprenyldiphospho-muramoylpentapeptide beta-N-acetylglucosaminyltransferase [Thiolinea disciformis]|uniref:undecaprenyldiphospho-muramoylpentapeptide beta-N-acetylglucosaminyltransferase n=1 Tax=Thiolinea disciformis TaxID=125614 RepID=UPI000372F2F9|nr:undecaprenyldiphospho-muramoylpentapeptide beta-N-acetylglucosaminyltransferase [Thiolinea disciformis]